MSQIFHVDNKKKKDNHFFLTIIWVLLFIVLFFPNLHIIGNYEDYYSYYQFQPVFRWIYLILSIFIITITKICSKIDLRDNITFNKFANIFNRQIINKIIIILGIIAIISYFISKNLLKSGNILQGDFIQAYYEMDTIKNNFLVNNGVPFGYSNDFYAGYFGFPFYTPGLSIYGAFLWILGISPDYYFRFIIIGVFFCAIYLVIKLINELKLDPFNKVLGFFLFFGTSGFTFYFRTGVPHDYIGICLGVGLSYIINKILINFKEERNNSLWIYPISSITLLLLMIIHGTFIILTFLIILSHLIIVVRDYIQYKKEKNENELKKIKIFIKKGTIFLFIIFGLMIIANSFWLLNVISNLNYPSFPQSGLNVYTKNNYFYSRIWTSRWLQELSVLLLPFFCIGIYSVLKEKKNSFLSVLSLSIILLLIFQFCTFLFFPVTQIPFGRTIYLLDLILPGFTLKGVSYIFSIKKKEFQRKNISKNIAYSMVIVYIILFSSFGFIFRFNNQYDFQDINDDTYQIFDWINDNTLNNSRILLEDSVFTREQVWGNGRVVSLAPIYTERSYIGGYHSVYFLYQSQLAGFYAGFVFNEFILNMSYVYFTKNLKEFNIEFIIAWSEESLEFLQLNNTEFQYIISIGDFSIFRYKNAVSSFCLDEKLQPINNEIIEFSPNHRKFKLSSIKIDEEVRLSFSDCNKLKLYVNGSEIEKRSEEIFISFKAPSSGDLIVDLVWENYNGEEYLFYIFIAIHPILLIITIYCYRKSKKIEKNTIHQKSN